jgi:hypothetical protein
VQDGLVVERQLTPGEGLAQVLAQLQVLHRALLHGRREVAEAVAPLGLGVYMAWSALRRMSAGVSASWGHRVMPMLADT